MPRVSERYKPQAIEKQSGPTTEHRILISIAPTFDHHVRRSITCWRCCRIPRASCISDTYVTLLSATPWLVTCGCRATTCFIPWDWDAFGLPARTRPSKPDSQPREWTLHNIASMKVQMKRLGFAYDWPKEVTTCLPQYYRWNQWFFLKFFEQGLAYRRRAKSTGVANAPRCWPMSRCYPTDAAGGTRTRRSNSASWNSGSCAPPVRR